jgi:2-C-methyl-D-erythritol 4-phosphate cytidylyltransferase
VFLVVPAGEQTELLALAAKYGLRKLSRVVAGGATRTESIWRGLQTVRAATAGIVAVHDGVRPFVTPEEIDRVVLEAESSGAAILASPVVETIKEVKAGRVARTLERRTLWGAQTPQCFRYELLRRAYEQAMAEGLEATDDSALVERLGASVSVLEGSARNVKITTPQDIALAELMLKGTQESGAKGRKKH